MHDDAWHLVQRLGIVDMRKVVFIVVNASTGPDPRWSLASSIPGIGQVLRAFKDIPIDRYSFETKELLAASFERWASDIKIQRKAAGDTAGDDLQFVMIDAASGPRGDSAITAFRTSDADNARPCGSGTSGRMGRSRPQFPWRQVAPARIIT